MPTIKELPELARPVGPDDTLLIEGPEGTRRLPATSFKGDTGQKGDQGEKGEQGERGESALGTRRTASITTGNLDTDQTATGAIDLAPSFEALTVEVSRRARVRLYSTSAARDADLARLVTTPPQIGQGLILEVNHIGTLRQPLDPHAHGSNLEQSPTAAIPYALTNTGPAGPITLTITYLPREDS